MQSNNVWIHIGAQKQILSFDTKKIQYLPHMPRPIDYGAKQQILQPTDTSLSLDDKGIKRVQVIDGALLYVGR